MLTLIEGATIVSDGISRRGSILIKDDTIEGVFAPGTVPAAAADIAVDAAGLVVMPGAIDSHVHFREPGMTAKADIFHESRAAAAGGVTTYFDMPNTKPATTTAETLAEKFAIASRDSAVNYAFFPGATADNIDFLASLDPTTVPGVKVFIGASTGSLLLDDDTALRRLMRSVRLPIVAHCEDNAVIAANMAEACRATTDPDVRLHSQIRSREACIRSTWRAIKLAVECGARLHVAHLSTAEECSMFAPLDPQITAEAVIGHLLFTDSDMATLGSLIKVNPAIKSADDRAELRRALADGRITTVGTDHAPHQLADKRGGAARAASGMPMVQFSVAAMLQLVDEGVITIERMVELMCHAPARLFGVSGRGFIRPGYKADLVLLRPNAPHTVSNGEVISKCGWTPLAGRTLGWRIERTWVNGQTVYEAPVSPGGKPKIAAQGAAQRVVFAR